jgi:hypothetical protein
LFTFLRIAKGFNRGKRIALYPTVETVGYGLHLFTFLRIAQSFNRGKRIALYPTVETVGYGFGVVCVFWLSMIFYVSLTEIILTGQALAANSQLSVMV